jgi:transcription elongation GreA/GreB family factor
MLLSTPDAARLRALIRSGHLPPSDKTLLSRLLTASAVARKDDDTFDRVCLYDHVTLVSPVDSRDWLKLTIVLPEDEDEESSRLAVTRDISRAVLGRRCGERVSWRAKRSLRPMLIAVLAKFDAFVR